MLYEIKKAGITYCSSSIKNCGYSLEILQDMRKAGYRLYCGGKISPLKRDVSK